MTSSNPLHGRSAVVFDDDLTDTLEPKRQKRCNSFFIDDGTDCTLSRFSGGTSKTSRRVESVYEVDSHEFRQDSVESDE